MKKEFIQLLVLLLIVGVSAPSSGHTDDDTSTIQLIALEGARQAMLETQLSEIAIQVEGLLADIATNAEVSEAVTTSASDVRSRLAAIRQMRLVPARELLSQAMKDQQKVIAAQHYIELAARDLASLLLQAGVSQASEVFVMELRVIIAMQEELQEAAISMNAPSGISSHVKQQIELAERLAVLIADLAALDHVPHNPLAAVRLSRAREIVEEGGVVVALRRAGEVWTTKPLDVAALQAQVLRHLRQSVLKLRPDASLEELARARTVVQEIGDSQRALRTRIAALTAAVLEGQKENLQLQQQRMLIPLQEFGEVMEIDLPLQIAKQAGSEAVEALQGGNTDAALVAQTRVEDAMTLARVQLNSQIDRMNSLSRTRRRMLDAASRMKSLTELRDRAESIRNSAYEVFAAQQDLSNITTAQQQLAQDISRFQSQTYDAIAKVRNDAIAKVRNDAIAKEQMPEEDHFASAISRSLRKAAQACEAGIEPLRKDNIDEANPYWLRLEATLDKCLDIATNELSVREKLWTFSQATADIRQLGTSLEDIQLELVHVREDVESAQRDGSTVLDITDQQALLTQAMQQAQENIGVIREAAPMNASISVTVESMSKAMENLAQDQPELALESIKQAIVSLEASRETKTRLVEQFELIPMEMNRALELSGRAMKLREWQIDLRETTSEASEEDFGGLAREQAVIHTEAKVLTSLTVAPGVEDAFRQAGDEMVAAMEQLKVRAHGPAIEHQQNAEVALQEGIQALDGFISTLVLAAGSKNEDVKVIAFLDGIQALVLLAAGQKELNELTLHTPDSLLPFYAKKEMEFSDRAKEISVGPDILTLAGRIAGWEHMEAAAQAMEQAAATLEVGAKDPTITHQQKAEKELRIAIAMNVVALAMALEEPGLFPYPTDEPAWDSIDHWYNFTTKAGVSGKRSEGKQGEWNSLVERERSALHENFARELPLEYRHLLKDYYRSLAK